VYKFLNTKINKLATDNVEPYAFIIKEFCLIEDSFQSRRIKWIFGIPTII